MHDRSILGPADVSDMQLTHMVADLLGTEETETTVLSSTAEEFPYDLAAITTAGRYWVRGTAQVSGEERSFELFVKHVQVWSRSPLFQLVPRELQPIAAAGVPWRTEPLAYRSDLGERLPGGLRMPRVLGVFDLDELSASVWLEFVEVKPLVWDLHRYAEAAHLLGRLATNIRLGELADVGNVGDSRVRGYFEGRLSHQVLPMLRDEGIWSHPLVVAAFGPELRTRLLGAADHVETWVEELSAIPLATGHGDACPNNLLVPVDEEGFVLIDYGFWGPMPIGFDLGQLLVGDVQVGRRGTADLGELDETIVAAYLTGLRAEECRVPAAVVRRAHALQLIIFTGLSSLPFEHLGTEPTAELHRVAAERAALARFSLDLVDATAQA